MGDTLNKHIRGDNGGIDNRDWRLSDFGEVLAFVQKMPKLDLDIRHYSQYNQELEGYGLTSCTITSGFNAFMTILNINPGIPTYRRFLEHADGMGWNPGFARQRGSGWYSVVKKRNEDNQDDKFIMFTDTILSEAFDTVMNKLGVVGISINGDSNFWKDIRDNFKIDNLDPNRGGGHATCLMLIDGKYKVVDSITKSYKKVDLNTPIVWEIGNRDALKALIDNGAIREDITILIRELWLQEEKSEEEIERLQKFVTNIRISINANSEQRHLTNQKEYKDFLHNTNNKLRAKLRIVEAMLT